MAEGAEFFDGLNEILTELWPNHALTRRDVTLEADAPLRMRQVWEATGTSDVVPPLKTRAESELELSRIFREWALSPVSRGAWGSDEASFRRALPERVRLVGVTSDRLIVTDETRDEADPPLIWMRARSSPTFRFHDHYTEWHIYQRLSAASWIREAQYFPSGPIDGQQILTEVYPPGLYALADRIWWLKMPAFSKKADLPVVQNPVIFVSARAYLEFLFKLPEGRLGLFGTPKSSVIEVGKPGPLDIVSKGPPKGFRIARRVDGGGATNWFRAIGPVGDTFVWLLMLEKGDLMVGFDPGARDEVRAWLKGHGVKVTRETPLAPQKRGPDGWRVADPLAPEAPPAPKSPRRKKAISAPSPAAVESNSPFALAVAVESDRIATLLGKNTPDPRQPVNLPDSDPPTVRAFWRAVGWNDKWPRHFHLHHPDVEQSVREMPQVLNQLKDESPKSPALKRGGLPKKFRIADIDRDGIGFRVTDEDDPQHREDPKVIGVIFETGAVFEEQSSYLKICADELISVSFSGWYTEFVSPSEIPPADVGETPFPTLSPTTRMLADNVWLLPAHPEAQPTANREIAYATRDDFTRVFARPPRRSHGG